jgi:hypothetical protein
MKRFTLSDSLILASLAVLSVAFKAVFRLKLGLTGHSMFMVTLVLLLARGLVPERGSVVGCGLVAGLMAMVMGIGRGGPLVLLKFLAPALAVEIICLLLPKAPWTRWQAVLAAWAGVAAWIGNGMLELALAGADRAVLATEAGLKALGGGLFATIAALLVPTLLKRLAHHDLVPKERQP